MKWISYGDKQQGPICSGKQVSRMLVSSARREEMNYNLYEKWIRTVIFSVFKLQSCSGETCIIKGKRSKNIDMEKRTMAEVDLRNSFVHRSFSVLYF